MGATYTRQSSATIVDGATIEASHFNAEFDQLLAAFAASSGHTHDGTANEGGPITKLLGNTLTFGAATTGTDITITFDGETNDGVLKWMEDEDYFEFSDDILVASTEKLQFRDTAVYINSSADGQLDLVADTEIQIAATTVDINGNVDISGTLTVAGALDFGDAALSNVGALQLDSIAGDADTNTSITFSGSDVITIATGGSGRLTIGDGALSPVTDNQIDLGTSSLEFKDGYFDGTITTDAIVVAGTIGHDDDTDLLTLANGIVTVAGEVSMTTLDIGGTNVTSTAAELNILDGVTSTTAELNILDGVTSTTAELNLVDGITAGTVTASKAVIVDSNKDLTGLRNLTIAGDLTVSGDDITMATNTAGHILVADGTNFNPVAVTDLSEISTVASGDIFLAVDASGGGLKKITRSAIVSGLATSSAISNVSEDSTPQLGGNLDLNGNDIVTTSNADLELAPNGTGHVTVRGNTNQGTIQFNCENNSHGQQVKAAPHSESASNVLTLPSTGGDARLVSTASTATLTNKTLTSPKINEDVAVTSTATELNVLDGITAVVGELNALDIGATAIGTAVASKAVILDANKDYTGFRNITLSGELDAGSLDVSGDADIDGTLEADAITIGGVTLAETISDTVGAMVGSNTETGIAVSYDDSDNTLDFVLGSSQTTITSLTNTSLVIGRDADNDIDFATDNTILFRAEGADQIKLVNGAIVPVTDNDIDLGTASLEFKDAYFDGTVTADAFAGPLTGNVTGNASGTAATVTGAAQSNITSLGTLTTLTVDNVIVNGATIGHTDDTDLITLADGIATVAGEISVTTLDIGGTNVTSTAAELNILDGVTSTAAELNFSDLATLGTTAASKVYTADANGLTKISGAALYVEDTLTDGSTVAWDVIASPVAKLTMAGNRTISAPSGTTPAAGQFVSLLLIQDGSGSRTITWNAVYEFTGDTAPTLTTTASKGDLFTFRYNGSKWLEVGRNLNLTLS